MTRTQKIVFVLGLLGLVFLPVIVTAQTVPDSYVTVFYNAGATQPVQQNDSFLRTAATCNQTPPTLPPGAPVNPRRVLWDDEVNAGKVCIFTFPTTGVLFSLPIPGSYEVALKAVNAAGVSAESLKAPFSRLAVAAVPTGVKAIP